jgi:hypothetical protein
MSTVNKKVVPALILGGVFVLFSALLVLYYVSDKEESNQVLDEEFLPEVIEKEFLCEVDDECCLSSLRIIEENKHVLLDKDGCPEGYIENMLRCTTSLKWCEPFKEVGEETVRDEESPSDHFARLFSLVEDRLFDFKPHSFAFSSEGVLYISDTDQTGIYQVGPTGVEKLPGLHSPRGVAVNRKGDICIGHYDSADILFRRLLISCLEGGQFRLKEEGVAVGGFNSFVSTKQGILISSWQHTMALQRGGVLLFMDERLLARDIPIYEFPQFAVVLPGGDVLVSVWREDGSGFIGGQVVRIETSEVKSPGEHYTPYSLFSDVFQRPLGLAVYENSVFIADAMTGEVAKFSMDGMKENSLGFFNGPSAIQIIESRACIAESDARRIRCLDI